MSFASAQELLIKGASPEVGRHRASPVVTNPALVVGDVWVDKTAENAVVARQQALEDAKRYALRKLAERNMSPEDFKNFKMPDKQIVGSLVQDFEITDEKIAAKRYIAKFTVRFRERVRDYVPVAMQYEAVAEEETATETATAADDLMAAPPAGIVTDDAVPPAAGAGRVFLLLPYFENIAGKTVLWEDPNPWRDAWQKNPPRAAGARFVVPVGDLNDVAAGPSDAVWSGNYKAVEKLQQNYKADEVVLAVGNKSGPYLTIDMYFFDKGRLRAREVVQPYVGDKPDDEAWRQGMYELAAFLQKPRGAAQARGVEDISRSITGNRPSIATVDTAAVPAAPAVVSSVAPAAVPGKLELDAVMHFNSLRTWTEAQRRLSSLSPAPRIRVRSMNTNGAQFTLDYDGSLDALQRALSAMGMSLAPSAVVVDGGAGQRQIYDLYMP